MSSRFACISFLRYIAYVKIVVTVTDPEFRNFFSQFGELQESVVMFDRETRRSRGFGFVTYVNPVRLLIHSLNNHEGTISTD